MKTLTAIKSLEAAITLHEDLKKLEANGDTGRFRLVFEHHDKDLEERVTALIGRRTSSRSFMGFLLAAADKEAQEARAVVCEWLMPGSVTTAPMANVEPMRDSE